MSSVLYTFSKSIHILDAGIFNTLALHSKFNSFGLYKMHVFIRKFSINDDGIVYTRNIMQIDLNDVSEFS